jgi:hypothetical protein
MKNALICSCIHYDAPIFVVCVFLVFIFLARAFWDISTILVWRAREILLPSLNIPLLYITVRRSYLPAFGASTHLDTFRRIGAISFECVMDVAP